ncbi:MAG: BlaI/MecI/CopY family transcriptional regulator [Candidatus Hydrogenedentes bacterium]|nr:BlaI/MecI/CopY family transcriptional regulator [Candidatus Hydrogenedentota bacterium]
MRAKQPSKLEMAILSLLWEHGGMTSREVLDALPDGKQRAYTSVLSVLQVMERKKLVRHTRRGNTNVYHAVAAQTATLGGALRDMVRDMFGGSPAAAVQRLLSEGKVSEAELTEVEKLIASLRKQQGRRDEGKP